MDESRRVSEFLRKARPRPGGASYRRLSGEWDEAKYRTELETERKRLGLPAITKKEEPAGA